MDTGWTWVYILVMRLSWPYIIGGLVAMAVGVLYGISAAVFTIFGLLIGAVLHSEAYDH